MFTKCWPSLLGCLWSIYLGCVLFLVYLAFPRCHDRRGCTKYGKKEGRCGSQYLVKNVDFTAIYSKLAIVRIYIFPFHFALHILCTTPDMPGARRARLRPPCRKCERATAVCAVALIAVADRHTPSARYRAGCQARA